MIYAPTDSRKVFSHPDRLATWLSEGRSFPVTIELDTTNACNHACSFCCWSVLHDQHRDTMSSELMNRIIDNLARVGVKGVIWTGGGEPLVNRNTPLGIARARQAGLKNAMFTNGALLTPEIARILVHSCEWVRISVAAGTAAEYQRIHGVDDFDKVRRNIAMLVETARREGSSIRLGASMLLHKSSLPTFLPFVEMCRELGLDFAQGKPNNNYDHAERSTYIIERNVRLRRSAGDANASIDDRIDDLDPQWWTEQAMPLLEQAQALATPRFSVVISQYTEMKYGDVPADNSGSHECHVNNFVTAITASGDVAWCKNYRDRPEFLIGNLREQTMEEIWASERRAQVQAMIDSRSCERFCQNRKLVHLLRSVRRPDPALNPDFL